MDASSFMGECTFLWFFSSLQFANCRFRLQKDCSWKLALSNVVFMLLIYVLDVCRNTQEALLSERFSYISPSWEKNSTTGTFFKLIFANKIILVLSTDFIKACAEYETNFKMIFLCHQGKKLCCILPTLSDKRKS